MSHNSRGFQFNGESIILLFSVCYIFKKIKAVFYVMALSRLSTLQHHKTVRGPVSVAVSS